MQSCEFALSVSTLACCIAEGKSPEEIALISSIFMQLGDTLATIAAHQALCSHHQPMPIVKKRTDEPCSPVLFLNYMSAFILLRSRWATI